MKRLQRLALVVMAIAWFGWWAWPASPDVRRAVPDRWPCLQAEVRHSGSGWSDPLPLKEAGQRADARILGGVGDVTPTHLAVRLASLDTPEVPDLIECLAAALGVDVRMALSVASCESSFDPQARNPLGPYIGVLQIQEDLFATRAQLLGLRGADPTDAWSNVYVGLNIVRQEGWSRWECPI